MRRHWSQRLVAMLGAVWFVLIGIEPAAFGACPAHEMAGSAVHAGHTMPMGDAASMDGASMEHHDTDAPAGHEHQCTCPGSCCGPTVVVVPSVQPAFALSRHIAGVPAFSEYQYRAPWVDFVLPFGTAPPQRLQA
jgi:hypothetical protein